jgi:3-dehydroquinate dehydratase-1
MKTIKVRGKPIAGGKQPLVCAPLVGKSRDALLAEAAIVERACPDVVEWRVDFFNAIENTGEVVDTAKALKRVFGGIPVLFTRRSAKEGGTAVAVSEEAVVELYAAVCAAGCADLVDFEMSNDLDHVHRVREACRRNKIGLVLSYHNFRETPPLRTLNQRFLRAQELGADVAKVAVMPGNLDDVLTLLAATRQSSAKLKIPLISMSMGAYGSLTRMFGWVFGSALTFGVGASGSAPGQLPIEDLNAVIAITRKAISKE